MLEPCLRCIWMILHHFEHTWSNRYHWNILQDACLRMNTIYSSCTNDFARVPSMNSNCWNCVFCWGFLIWPLWFFYSPVFGRILGVYTLYRSYTELHKVSKEIFHLLIDIAKRKFLIELCNWLVIFYHTLYHTNKFINHIQDCRKQICTKK